MDLHATSAAVLSKALAAKQISSVELTKTYLERIGRLNPSLNTLITVCEELALEQAQAADTRRANGAAGRLTGIPYVNKDIFCTKGILTTCASKMLANFVAPYDAHVVEKLNAAGMVMLGKANMDEFAMGSSNETSHFGAVRNPWDLERVPGGSSGGSAAAIAAGLAPLATGTDTGGSIRQPAAFCGISGLKPTYGRVSRYGMVAFASSLDQGGPMARDAEDLALMLTELAGFDERDSTSADCAPEDFTSQLNSDLRGLRIGLPMQFFSADLTPGVEERVRHAVDVLQRLGAEVREVCLRHANLAIPAYYVIASAECSSNLSRYDGVRFGHRCEDPSDLTDLYRRSRSEGFGEEVKRRILVGTYALSAGYYDAYYGKAQRIRRLVQQDFAEAFETVDVIAGPATPQTAFELGAFSAKPVDMYLQDIYTTAVNLAGLPAMSIPAGFSDGLPVGLQLIGNLFDEGRLLRTAHAYQQFTDWHLQQPAGLKKLES